MKNKHLSFDDRLEIEKGLKENKSFKAIGNIINKDCTTVAKDVAKEIKNHIIFKEVGTVGRKHFNCKKGKNCPFRQKGKMVIISKSDWNKINRQLQVLYRLKPLKNTQN